MQKSHNYNQDNNSEELPISILVLENETEFIEVITYMTNEYTIYTAKEPKEALSLYKDFKPPIIMISESFEQNIIIEVVKSILSINPSAFIILLIKRNSKISKTDLKDVNIKYCMTKPFSRKTLKKYLYIYSISNKSYDEK